MAADVVPQLERCRPYFNCLSSAPPPYHQYTQRHRVALSNQNKLAVQFQAIVLP
jgi:hypothetical protein